MLVDMDKPRLLDLVRTERAFLERTLALLSDEQMIAPDLDNGRSVKDVLAHIAAWEQTCIGWIETARNGAEPPKFGPGFSDDVVDKFNEDIYIQNKDRSLDDVRAEFQRSYEQIVQLTESLSDDELFDPVRFPFLKNPAYLPVYYNTYGHYLEHAEEIRTKLKK